MPLGNFESRRVEATTERTPNLSALGSIATGVRKVLFGTLVAAGAITTVAYLVDASANAQRANELRTKADRGRPDIYEEFPASDMEISIAEALNMDYSQVQIAPEVSWEEIEKRGIAIVMQDSGRIKIVCGKGEPAASISIEAASPIVRSKSLNDANITHVLPSSVRIAYAGSDSDHQKDDLVIQHFTLHGATFPDDTDGDGKESDVVSAQSTFAVINPKGELVRISRETTAMSEEHTIINAPLAWQRSLPLPRFVTNKKNSQ